MNRTLALAFALVAAGSAWAESPKPTLKPVELVLEDQFGKRQELAGHRGAVVVLVYGDRGGTDACRELGEKLHVLFHPTAAGQPPAKARAAPVAPLPGFAKSPDVLVVPVAVPGKVPEVVRDLLRTQIKLASPDVPVWLDFAGVMEKEFGLRAGQTNLAVFDAQGRLRLKVNGTADKATLEKLLQTLQDLRAEAVAK
jgi:hypothetical protein